MANQYKNKVIYNGNTLIDISDTTAVASDVNAGKYIYLANGSKVQGSQNVYSITGNYTQVTSDNSSSKILGSSSYVSEIVPTDGYLITSVTVMMGGVDITDQVFFGSNGTEYLLQPKTVSANGVVYPDQGFYGLSSVTVNVPSESPALQNKTVTPTTSQQTVTADSGYDALGTVTVNKIPTEYVIPSGSQTITNNGTYDISSKAQVIVDVPTGGGSTYIVDINNVSSPTSTWTFPIEFSNTLSSGGSFEVEFYDPSPSNDYADIIGFGAKNALSSWSTNTAINFFHSWVSGTTDAIVIRQSSTSSYANIDSSSPIKLKIDKDYIYVNNVAVVATASQIKNQTNVTFGSMQGSKRFTGTFNSIKAL